MRPVGPLPPGVYWLRRLLLVLLVVVLLAAVWWVFLRVTSDGSGTDPAALVPSESPTPSPSPSDAPSPAQSPTGQPSASTPGAVPDCRPREITVSVTTNASTYSADEQPQFTLFVTNDGTVTCRRDVGQSALELVVSSGDVQVWSSDDCNPGGPSAVRTFGPGDQWSQAVTWSLQQSAPGCPSAEPLAPAGSYQVVARNLQRWSEPADFVLR